MKIIMGADPLGYDLKEIIKAHLIAQGIEVEDITPTNDVDYFSVGEALGKRIATGEFTRGFIFCGTGMGVNIVANKYQGVYSALCESIETARLARVINNANVLAMGGIVMTPYMAKQMADVFLNTPFSEGFSEANPEFLKGAYTNVQATEAKITSFNNTNSHQK
ncbi:RpiB/LacA/LacB family sugar-phosphate isomerase [Lactiplantibacillus sp. DA1]|uniref:RpiB/LacA/LacB family sugar-phosphate isomerase n=1 Tax=Lactiplantibacillus sp. DA1 TaxID=3079857 RepID=UPI00292A624D|nr:RpiB/LacA/LacB family sugar-phosphate isomerase [Lactiplantibacillus sp. DA1]MDV0430524.1 RpiB/LacA/LacB family sugar-phosphate isomerase [Lactiplantibacillus sp. DA1]